MRTTTSPKEVLVADDLLLVDLGDPRPMVDICDSVAHIPFTSFLDSSLEMNRLGRYSFLGFHPFAVLQTKGTTATIIRRGGRATRLRDINPFEALGRALKWQRSPEVRPAFETPPFLGGGIGYLSYELGRHVEKLPATVEDDLGLPELFFAFYDQVVACDHLTGDKFLAVAKAPGDNSGPHCLHDKATSALEALGATNSGRRSADNGNDKRSLPGKNFTRDSYIEAVKRVKEYILAGDIYQANLSQRFSSPFHESPWSLYRRLRKQNPAPFSAYLNCGSFQVASSSPERFLKVEGNLVETRPIKGTRGRSEDPEADRALKEELGASEKDLAELSMIVDLERNDLGRVCSYGTIEVAEHAVIETYATVHHLVSTIVGRLHKERDVIDLLKATFPGGSITGAPKIRAMEIIDEIESTERSIYTGSIGYIGHNGFHDLNIAIRTMILRDGLAYFQLGGGIVADSDPEDEYQETLEKGRAIFQTVSGTDYPE